MKFLIRNTMGMVAVLLAAGCASVPETRFYTLSVPSEASQSKDASARAPETASRPILIEVMPINVPERLARPQLVVRSQSLGQDTQLFILEQDRWSSYFNYELRDAFATGISNRIGAINESRGSHAPDQPIYRIAVELSQFDAIVGDKVQARFGWTVTRSTDGRGVACYSAVSEPVVGGIKGVVKGIQHVVSSVVADISRSLTELDAGHAVICAPQKGGMGT